MVTKLDEFNDMFHFMIQLLNRSDISVPVNFSSKEEIHNTYCSNLYNVPMWFDCTKAVPKRLKIAYNNYLWRFMVLPWRDSATEMFVYLEIHYFDEMLRM